MTAKLKEDVLKKFEKEIPLYHKTGNIEIISLDSDYLVHNELMLIRCSTYGKIKWVADCHHDVITKVKIEKEKIKVTEFDGKTYYLSVNNGKVL